MSYTQQEPRSEGARRAPAQERLARDVTRLRAALPALLPRGSSPVLVVVSGLPASGKSHFSRMLAARLPLVILESDALRKALVGRPTYSGPENGRLFRASHELTRQLLVEGVAVLFDATSLVEAHRARLYRVADGLAAPVAVVALEAPPGVIRRRLARRKQGLDPQDRSDAGWEVYERMRSQVEPVRRDHLVVDTSRDVSSALDHLERWYCSATAAPSSRSLP